MKKFLSILLALTLVIGLLPAIDALAANVVASGSNTADFSAFKATADTGYKSYTSSDGWSVENAAINNTLYSNTISVVLNGKTSAPGKLTSGTLNVADGLKKISFSYGFPNSDNQFKITISVKQNGNVVASNVLEKTGLASGAKGDHTWTLDNPVTGDFTIEIVNNCKSNSGSNKDRLAICNLSWGNGEGGSGNESTESTEAPTPTFTAGLITSVSKLEENGQYVIVNPSAEKAMSTTQNTNNRGTADVIIDGNTVGGQDDVQIVTLEKSGDLWMLKVGNDSYLYASGGSSNNYLKTNTKANVGEIGKWQISIAADGVATIKAQNTDRNWLRYNSGNNIFSCYASGQQDIMLYKVGYAGDAPGVVTATKVNSISEITSKADGELLEVTGVVTYVSYTKVYIQDSTGAIQVSMAANANCKFGDTITVTATKGNGVLSNGTFVAASTPLTLTAVPVSNVAALNTTAVGSYVKLENLTVSKLDGDYTYLTDGTTEIVVYKMKGGDNLCKGDTVTLEAVLDQYNNTKQLRNYDDSLLEISQHTPHDYTNAEYKQGTNGHYQNCTVCGRPSAEADHVDTATKDHNCDLCGKTGLSTCSDAANDGDHNCDHCGQPVASSTCSDSATDTDHNCDECGKENMNECTDAAGDNNHNCDICGKVDVSACSDVVGDGNHNCDECGKTDVTGHVDENSDNKCDECDSALCTDSHIDAAGDSDHRCDACGIDNVNACSDSATDTDHKCDECGKDNMNECTDAAGDNDHNCDICGKEDITECSDSATDTDHKCDECGKDGITDCSDSATDKDHKCDVCGKDDMNDHDWEDATTEAPKTCKICGKTEGEPLAPTGAGLITDISKLKDGDKIVIIATGANKGLSTNQKSNNRGTVAVVKTGNTVDLPEELQVFEVDILENGKFTLKCVNGDTAGKYIYGGETSNRLKSSDTVDDKGTWTITISADGVATIKSIAGNRDWLRYNNASNDLFACYASGQQDVSIYKLGYAGDAPQEVKATETNVAGIKNAANGDKLQIKGIVTNVYYTTIYIQDETGAVKVVLGANFPGKVGDTIVVTGIKNNDGSIASATYVASSGMTLAAKEITAANLSTLDIGTYVKIAGLTVSKINLNDDDKITSIEFNAGSVTLVTSGTILTDDDIKVGDTVTITGTNAGDNKVWNVSYVVTTAGTGNEGGNTGNEGGNTGNEGGNTGNEGGNTGNEGGNTGNEGGNTGNEGTTTPVTKPTVQANPVVGSKYIFGMKQVKKNVTLYFSGEMDGYYLGTTEDPAKAVEVQMESVEGGYRLFFMKDGKKTYIDIIPRDNAEGKVNVVLTETPAAVYTYNKDLKTFTTKVVDKEWYLGTYNDFTTFSASETWRITGDNASAADSTQYIAHMYAMTTVNVPSNGDTALSTIVALFVISAMGVVALVAKKKEF